MLAFLFLLTQLALIVLATPLKANFWSCDSFYTRAPQDSRLSVSDVFATIVPGSRARELGLPGDGRDVLRINLFGEASGTISGYSNDTNKLGALGRRCHDCGGGPQKLIIDSNVARRRLDRRYQHIQLGVMAVQLHLPV